MTAFPAAASVLLDYQGGTNPIYVGKAQPVAANAGQPVWQICKITYDGNSNPIAVQYAGGSTEYAFIWNNRTSFQYA
jgi:hypothetical protein